MAKLTELKDADSMTAALRVREGLPVRYFADVAKEVDLSRESLAKKLRLNMRTLSRRKNRLNAEESERIYRTHRVMDLACEVLGSAEEARRWLSSPIESLGDAVPLDCLDTDLGTAEVERVLRAIEWGVYL